MTRLSGRTILITGAAKGQGAHEARCCADEGASVVVTDVLDTEGAEVASRVGGSYHHLDVSDSAQWDEVTRAIVADHGRIDGLVNNAGIFRAQPLLDSDEETTRRIFEINQLGVYFGMKTVAPVMRDGGGGSIVNISSIGGMRGYPAFAYGASKWAVRGMTKTAARELAPHGIRVNSVHPGLVDTDMLVDTPPARLRELGDATPMGRIGSPDDIAGPVVFLLSDESSYMTGAELVVDGGVIA